MDSSPWSSLSGCWGASLLAWSTYLRWIMCTGTWLLGTFWSTATWCAKYLTLASLATSRMTPQIPPTPAPWWVFSPLRESMVWVSDGQRYLSTHGWVVSQLRETDAEHPIHPIEISAASVWAQIWPGVYLEATALLSQWQEQFGADGFKRIQVRESGVRNIFQQEAALGKVGAVGSQLSWALRHQILVQFPILHPEDFKYQLHAECWNLISSQPPPAHPE